MPGYPITVNTLRYRARRNHGVTREEWAGMTMAEYAALEQDRMAEVKQREHAASARTAAVMALLCNLHRKKGTRPYTADDFLPRCSAAPDHSSRKTAAQLMATFAMLTRQNRKDN